MTSRSRNCRDRDRVAEPAVAGSGRAVQPKRISVINMWDRSTTSMHELVTEDNVQAMQEALAQDPESVNQLNESGLPPLYTAALYRNRQAIDFLLEHGAVVDIFACAYLGKATDADFLLKRNPDLVRVTTPNGMTALHYAAMAGHFDVADILLRYHADVHALDNQGTTALMEACHAGPRSPNRPKKSFNCCSTTTHRSICSRPRRWGGPA